MSKGRWFRYYDEALTDPRVQRLPAQVFKFWVNCLSLASKRGGDCGTTDDVMRLLGLRRRCVQRALDLLQTCGLLRRINDRYTPSDWAIRQYVSDQSTQRVRDWRKRFRESAAQQFGNVAGNVSETAQKEKEKDITSSLPWGSAREEAFQDGVRKIRATPSSIEDIIKQKGWTQ